MDRRHFIKTATASATLAAAALAAPRFASAAEGAGFNPNPANGWRVFEVTSRIEVSAANGAPKIWLPLPAVEDAGWIRPMGNLWQGNAAAVQEVRDPVYGARMLAAQWDAGEPAPVLEAVSRFATRDRAVDLSKPGKVAALDKASRALYTRATELLPTDGIVKIPRSTSSKGAKTDLDKARAIYEWIVDNTERNPKTRGCGTGDIRTCSNRQPQRASAPTSTHFTLAWPAPPGLPARDVYGVRVADSKFGYKSLGKSGDISKAQHCRAEVWLERFRLGAGGPGGRAQGRAGGTARQDAQWTIPRSPRAQAALRRLGDELAGLQRRARPRLPGSTGSEIPFLMYPQGELAGQRFDSLDPAMLAKAPPASTSCCW
jgi:transglutaminase-like putative cysteine protease